MIGNTLSGHAVDLYEDFAAYEDLPPLLRRVLRRARRDYDATVVRQQWWRASRRGIDLREFAVVLIDSWSHDEAEHTYRDYGPLHPEADNHGRRLRPSKAACWTPGKTQ